MQGNKSPFLMEFLDQIQEGWDWRAPEAWVNTWPEVPILDPVSTKALVTSPADRRPPEEVGVGSSPLHNLSLPSLLRMCTGAQCPLWARGSLTHSDTLRTDLASGPFPLRHF